jgi:transcription elongation factor GreA
MPIRPSESHLQGSPDSGIDQDFAEEDDSSVAELPVIKRLRKELETLKRELTVDLPKELERARAHGDLSENAEWAMAKQRQEFLRARVTNLELRIAELMRINLDSIPRSTVGLGSRVELEDLDGGVRTEYEIVVPEEVDGAQNRISLSSPLGRAMIGKGPDDDIEVQTPRGKRSYLVCKLVTIHELIAADTGNGSGSN